MRNRFFDFAAAIAFFTFRRAALLSYRRQHPNASNACRPSMTAMSRHFAMPFPRSFFASTSPLPRRYSECKTGADGEQLQKVGALINLASPAKGVTCSIDNGGLANGSLERCQVHTA
jgi:hypothetical protein